MAEENIEKKQSIETIKNISIIVILCIMIVVCIILGISFIPKEEKKDVIIEAESSLKEILEESELSTLEYYYNSVLEVKNEKETKYHVAYKGIVKLGFDFSQIEIKDNKDESKIVVYIPKATITSTNVDESSIDIIYAKNKYQTEKVLPEALAKANEDLKSKTSNNESINKVAEDNAITNISALMKPWEEELPDGYTIDYVIGGVEDEENNKVSENIVDNSVNN